MAAKGEKKTLKEGGSLMCGLALVEEILAINPTNEQKAKLYGWDLDESREETEYLGKNDAGDEKLNLDIYYRLSGGHIKKHRFFLENAPIEIEGKDGEDDKFKWVNQIGQATLAASKEDLPQWFTEFQKWDDEKDEFVTIGEKKTYRKCLKGEDQLMRFLREALSIDYELPSADLSYNYKKLFAGNVKELLTDLQGELFRKFVVMTQITTSQDGNDHYEKLWLPNNNFKVPTLPELAMKNITNGVKFAKGWIKNRWDKYVDTHKNYPPSGFAPLEPLKPYDSSEDVSAGTTAKKPEKKKASVSDEDDDY